MNAHMGCRTATLLLRWMQVRGKNVPRPVRNWNQCGLSSRIVDTLRKAGMTEPMPIQVRSMPAILLLSALGHSYNSCWRQTQQSNVQTPSSLFVTLLWSRPVSRVHLILHLSCPQR